MRVKSIGWRTDLELRRLEGARITASPEHLTVRSVENPTFRWGNFVLMPTSPQPGDAPKWLARFAREFPEADYVAIGIDSPSGERGAIEELAAFGVRPETQIILTATALTAPRRERPQATFRRVQSDEDWRCATDLSLANDEQRESPGQRAYAELRMRAIRRVCEQGHGAWFGAFVEDEMRAGLGIFPIGPELARFQAVDAHPAHRRQGLASHLLYTAGQHALSELGARTLVIAADPDYHAIDLYRSLGFVDRERQLQLERVAGRGSTALQVLSGP
jgi:GNAT superfamily N-acetyltransferase